MNLFRLILLGCAGCHVSNPNCCHAIHHRDGGTGTLSAAGSGLEVLHRSMRRSQRRSDDDDDDVVEDVRNRARVIIHP